MNSEIYIISELRKLIEEESSIKSIRYEFNELLDMHLIEILPQSAFEKNTIKEFKISEEVEKKWKEDILFISEESLTSINSDNVLWESERNN
jgi:hypothetical protein